MATAPPSSAVPASENKFDMPKDTPNDTPRRPHPTLLPLLFLTHILHLTSSLIVLSLAAYLTKHFSSSYAAYEMRAQGHSPFYTTLVGWLTYTKSAIANIPSGCYRFALDASPPSSLHGSIYQELLCNPHPRPRHLLAYSVHPCTKRLRNRQIWLVRPYGLRFV